MPQVNKSKENELNAKQRKAIHLLIYQCYTQTKVASEINVAEKTISQWLNSNSLFMAEYDKELEKAASYRKRQFKIRAQRAADIIYDLAKNAENETVRFNAAREILERAEDKKSKNTFNPVEINITRKSENNDKGN